MTADLYGINKFVYRTYAIGDYIKDKFTFVEKDIAVAREENIISESHINARIGHFNAHTVGKVV